MEERRTFCRVCGVSCGLVLDVDGDRVVGVRGDPDDPMSRGYTCSKGRALGELHHHEERLDGPLLRDAGGQLVPVRWDTCLDDLAVVLGAVRDEHGGDAIAVYMATASTYDSLGSRYAARFVRGLGTRNRYSAMTIDAAAKPLVAELVAGRSDIQPAIDEERTTLTVFIGCNPVVSHGHYTVMPDPVVRLRPLATDGRELWVVDPRRTETARLATRHLQPRPGTDWALVAHLVRELLVDGADQEYLAERAEGVDRLRAAVEPFDLATTVARTGLPERDVTDLLAAIRRHGKLAAQTGTGTTMSRAANVTEWLTWALHIVTGSYDRPGGMWFNPGFLGCHDRRRVPEPPAEVSQPGPPSRPDLPSRNGEYPCAALVDQIESGAVRALVVHGGNPVSAFPQPERLAAAFRRLDVLAVTDVRRTETTELATHVLACTGQLERSDVPYFLDQYLPVIASRYTPAVVPPGADRRPAWRIWHDVGARMGIPVLPDDVDPVTVTEDDLHARTADRARQPFAALREARVIVDEPSTYGWVEASLPGGRWRAAPPVLVDQLAQLAAEPIDPAPLALIPRRQARHMNSLLRDIAAPRARPDAPEVLVHPDDARAAGVVDGATVEVRGAAGTLRAVARLDDGVRPGVVSVPHGWTGEAHVGRLVTGATGCDPITGMVQQSGLPVTLAPV